MITPTQVRRGLASLPQSVAQYGVSGGLRRWSATVYHHAFSDITGRSIFDEDWDICIILDACRADELERFRDEYEWLETIDRFPSLASCTWNWVPRTVEETPSDVLQRTTYVTANPFPEELTEEGTFGELDTVYKYAWDHDIGTVQPRPVTDRAIHHWRQNAPERMLVHYIQPHVPFLTDDADPLSRSNFTHERESVHDAWDRVTRGELDRDVAIDRYRTTLFRVLEDVDLLLSNVDADDVVVTSDHGEAFGEWGLYGHPQAIDIPCLTCVPWVETSAVNEEGYVPAEYETEEGSIQTDEQLRALGYAD